MDDIQPVEAQPVEPQPVEAEFSLYVAQLVFDRLSSKRQKDYSEAKAVEAHAIARAKLAPDLLDTVGELRQLLGAWNEARTRHELPDRLDGLDHLERALRRYASPKQEALSNAI